MHRMRQYSLWSRVTDRLPGEGRRQLAKKPPQEEEEEEEGLLT